MVIPPISVKSKYTRLPNTMKMVSNSENTILKVDIPSLASPTVQTPVSVRNRLIALPRLGKRFLPES